MAFPKSSEPDVQPVSPTPTVTNIPTPTVTNVPTPTISFRETYVNGCVSENSSKEFCGCTYDYLLEKYGLNKMAEFGINSDSQESQDAVLEAVVACY